MSIAEPGTGPGPCARPIAAIISVVLHQSRVLLVQRANPPDAGRWGFPGGKIELGETVGEAAVRELKEETGVHGEALRTFVSVDVIVRNEDQGIQHHFVLLAVLCRWLDGQPVAGDDALQARWFDIAELNGATLDLSDEVAEIARQAAQL